MERRRKRRCLSYENSQTFAVVRRWLVVCPPHWLLPRIRGGQCFFKGGRSIGLLPRCAVFIACIGILREDRSFLPDCTLIVLYRIKMEFLCEVFEQIENIKISRSGQSKNRSG